MPDSPPTVSVCLPVYNAERYVRQAVDSVLAQTFADFELIVIDDGSTDGSRGILEELARGDSRIRLVSRPNTGYTRALNEALSLARGTFIARMDADDVSLPDRFQLQVDYLRGHPDCVLLGSRILMVDPYGVPQYEPDHRPGHDEIDQLLLKGVGWAVVHPAAMMVRADVTALGGYRPEMEPCEDMDLFLRLAERGRIANLPVVLLQYRQHVKSVNHTRAAEQDDATRRIITDAYRRRGLTLPPDWNPPTRDLLPVTKEIDMWAWVALKAGHVAVARRHAMSLLRLAPFSVGTWRLAFCAARGH